MRSLIQRFYPKFGLLSLFLTQFLTIWAFPVAAQKAVLNIDMREPIRQGWFDPTAEQIGLRGGVSPLSWNTTILAADQDKDGVYTAVLPFDRAGKSALRVSYKFKVEANGDKAKDNPNGGWEEGDNRGFVIENADVTLTRKFNEASPPLPPTFTGNIASHPNFRSKYVASRDLFVYLPAEYAANPNKRYPVLYMHDGRNVFDSSIINQEWEMDEAAQRLISEGKIEPVIIVGVNNTAQRMYEYTPDAAVVERVSLDKQGAFSKATDMSAYTGTYQSRTNDGNLEVSLEGGSLWFKSSVGDAFPHKGEAKGSGRFQITGSETMVQFNRNGAGEVRSMVAENLNIGGGGAIYGKFLVEEVKPFIDRTYRTKPDARNTFVGGSSLGGLISMYLGIQYPNVFGGLLVVSPSAWWNKQSIIKMLNESGRKARQKIWVDMGTGEGNSMLTGAQALRDALVAKGWREGRDLHYQEFPRAEHNEGAWAQRTPDMLLFLLKK
jgi:predicted alpha/beta superfamily hydrolase